MRCSCVILNYCDSERTMSLARVLAAYGQVARVVVVDNCSPDDSWERLQQIAGIPKVVLLQSGRNGGYGAGNNVGLRYCLNNPLDEPRQLVMVANPDTMISESAIAETVECFKQHPKAIACSPWQYETHSGNPYKFTAWDVPSGPVLAAQSLVITKRIFPIRYHYPSDSSVCLERFSLVGCLSGALVMLDAGKFSEIGLFDESVFLFYEEMGLGKRAEGRFETYLCTREKYYHEGSASVRVSYPSFRRRAKLLGQSRRQVLFADYHATGFFKLFVQFCYGISLIEAWPLAWAYNIYCLIREKKQ